MSESERVSYKELQKEAKKCGIPANMKRAFLVSAIEAYAENDQEKLNSIVQYHKKNRKRRGKTSAEPEKSKAKKAKNDAAAVSPFAVVLNHLPEHDAIDLTDDDDDNPDDFHPDSTSTPNRRSFSNRFTFESENSHAINAFSSLNNVHVPYESRSGDLTSYYPSVPGLLPRNLSQESLAGDKSVVCSSYYDTPSYKTPFLHHTQSQLCLYDNSNYYVARENYYPLQSSFTSRYHESGTHTLYPEIGHDRQLMICPSTIIENEFSSKYLPNVPQLSDVRERTPTLDSPCPQNLTVANNARSIQSASSCNTNQENLVHERFDNRVTDAGSISAEFDSNSDTDSLSLPDDVASFFDAELDTENRKPAHSPNFFNLYPRPNITSEVIGFDDLRDQSPLNSIRDEGTNAEKSGRPDGEYSQDSGIGSLVPYRPAQLSNDLSLDTSTLLPSVTTLLPDSNMQAYYQAYMKLAKTHCDLNPALDNSSNQFLQLSDKSYNTTFLDDLQNATDGTLLTRALESSHYLRNFSIPYLTSNSNQSSSMLRTFPANKSASCTKHESILENYSVQSSMIENLTVVPMDIIEEAMEEICEMNGTEDLDLNSMSKNTTSGEFLSTDEGTRVVYTHESVSIQGTIEDNKIQKDVRRKLFEIMNEPAKSITTDTAAAHESTTQNDSDVSPVSCFRPCKNYTYGCVDIFKNNEAYAQEHEKACLYQIVHCPLDKCDWCDIMKTLTTHIYECHKTDLNIGDEYVYVVNRIDKEEVPFVTYFQLHEGTIFVITLHFNEKKCITTMQYLPEIETTDYKNKRIKGVMQLIHFTSKVESKCWKGVVQPYFENDETLYQKNNTLQSTIANSKNIVLRVQIK